MSHRLFVVFLVVAIAFFVWAGALFAGWGPDYGNAWAILSLGLASYATAHFHLCGHQITSP